MVRTGWVPSGEDSTVHVHVLMVASDSSGKNELSGAALRVGLGRLATTYYALKDKVTTPTPPPFAVLIGRVSEGERNRSRYCYACPPSFEVTLERGDSPFWRPLLLFERHTNNTRQEDKKGNCNNNH